MYPLQSATCHELDRKVKVGCPGSWRHIRVGGPPCASASGTCLIFFTFDGPGVTVTAAVNRSPLGVQAPVTAVIAWMVPSTAVQRRASHKSDRAGSGARTAASAASSASSFSISRLHSNRSVSSDWAISIRNMGNGPRRRHRRGDVVEGLREQGRMAGVAAIEPGAK